ncbi:pyridoxal-phosphate dependent enzyme family protein [Mycobacterium xenopi 4042]|uniref:Pyridoxal-phosphate dependent enzyme family protein n=1 Tax=Mycobacterium xenopi 4042 TaxID=1299334 RepID=X8AA70_MYCXE|nr:pyridoxal-phosphate dependent enzyme family protein [Mycobacterium xenopi 4042]
MPQPIQQPDNVDAYRPLAHELLDQLGHIDVLVCSVGTGGHSAGVARVLRQANPDLQLIGVDTIGSTIFGQPAASRLMRGLGSSIYPRNVDYGAFAEVHWVAPAEAVWASRTLAATYYTSGGWSVGAVALVAGWAARTYPRGTSIAAVFADGPQRYFDTIYNDDYCRDHGLLDVAPPTHPDQISTPTEAIVDRWTRCTTVVDPTTLARTQSRNPKRGRQFWQATTETRPSRKSRPSHKGTAIVNKENSRTRLQDAVAAVARVTTALTAGARHRCASLRPARGAASP